MSRVTWDHQSATRSACAVLIAWKDAPRLLIGIAEIGEHDVEGKVERAAVYMLKLAPPLGVSGHLDCLLHGVVHIADCSDEAAMAMGRSIVEHAIEIVTLGASLAGVIGGFRVPEGMEGKLAKVETNGDEVRVSAVTPAEAAEHESRRESNVEEPDPDQGPPVH